MLGYLGEMMKTIDKMRILINKHSINTGYKIIYKNFILKIKEFN